MKWDGWINELFSINLNCNLQNCDNWRRTGIGVCQMNWLYEQVTMVTMVNLRPRRKPHGVHIVLSELPWTCRTLLVIIYWWQRYALIFPRLASSYLPSPSIFIVLPEFCVENVRQFSAIWCPRSWLIFIFIILIRDWLMKIVIINGWSVAKYPLNYNILIR